MFDLKITGGTVVDGTGADRFTADVAIRDGKIVEVHRRGPNDPVLSGDSAETIDAGGKIVAQAARRGHTIATSDDQIAAGALTTVMKLQSR